MLKYVSQFFLQICPSIVATVVGAYIVNYYIVPKAQSDTKASYARSAPEGGQDLGAADVPSKDATPKDVAPKDVAKTPAKAAKDTSKDAPPKAEAAAAADPAKGKLADTKSTEAKTDKPAEPVRVIDLRRPSAREKTAVRSSPTTPAPAAPATPATETAALAPPAAAADERRDRDANEIARAAIERLRSSEPARAADAPKDAPRDAQRASEPVRETSREPVAAKPASAGIAAAPPQAAVQPLPPPVTVAVPAIEAVPGKPLAPPYAAPAVADANRPVPPADIPGARPIDLQSAAQQRPTNVADDMLSAARSMIHAVVPQ